MLVSLFNYHPSFWKVNYKKPQFTNWQFNCQIVRKISGAKIQKTQHHNGRTLSKHFFSHCVMCKSAISDGDPKYSRIGGSSFFTKIWSFLRTFHLSDWGKSKFSNFPYYKNLSILLYLIFIHTRVNPKLGIQSPKPWNSGFWLPRSHH